MSTPAESREPAGSPVSSLYSEDRFVMTIWPASMVFSHVISVRAAGVPEGQPRVQNAEEYVGIPPCDAGHTEGLPDHQTMPSYYYKFHNNIFCIVYFADFEKSRLFHVFSKKLYSERMYY